MGQTKDERKQSLWERNDLIDRVRERIHDDDKKFPNILARVFGEKPDQTVISSCISCNNEIVKKDDPKKKHVHEIGEEKGIKKIYQSEVCCYGLFKGKEGGLQWRCVSAKPDSRSISRSTENYIIDNQGSKSFKKGSGSINDVCKSLGNQLDQNWSGYKFGFVDLTSNEKSCQAATEICTIKKE